MACGCAKTKLTPAASKQAAPQRPAQQGAPAVRPRGGEYWQRRSKQNAG